MNIEHYLTERHQGTHRQIMRLLRQGRVTLNGAVIVAGHTQVDSTDQVQVDGAAVTGRQPQYLLVNKPMGVTIDLNPTVAHSVGSLLNVLDQQRQLGAVADLPKEVMGVVVLSDDHRFLDDVRQIAWPSTLTTRLTGTAVPAELANAAWDQVQTTVNQRQKYVTVTVRTQDVARALPALVALPNATGSVTRTALGPLQLPGDLPIGTYRGMHAAEIDAVVAPLDADVTES